MRPEEMIRTTLEKLDAMLGTSFWGWGGGLSVASGMSINSQDVTLKSLRGKLFPRRGGAASTFRSALLMWSLSCSVSIFKEAYNSCDDHGATAELYHGTWRDSAGIPRRATGP